MNDWGDRIEEGEGAFAGFLSDGLRKLRPRQRPCSDNRRMVLEPVDALANYLDIGVLFDPMRDFCGKALAVDRQSGAGWNAMLVGSPNDQRAKRAHFLVEQPDSIVLGIV